MIDIGLVTSDRQTIPDTPEDPSTKAGNLEVANRIFRVQALANSLKVSFDTELSRHRPPLNMNHFHERIASCSDQPQCVCGLMISSFNGKPQESWPWVTSTCGSRLNEKTLHTTKSTHGL
jgi:hypothetical protein